MALPRQDYLKLKEDAMCLHPSIHLPTYPNLIPSSPQNGYCYILQRDVDAEVSYG